MCQDTSLGITLTYSNFLFVNNSDRDWKFRGGSLRLDLTWKFASVPDSSLFCKSRETVEEFDL
jgi:hypothetical protein